MCARGPVPEVDGVAALQALGETYRAVTRTVKGLATGGFSLPTRCEGWTVRDLLFHLLLDPQRALVALATPTTEPPTTDWVAYWRGYPPGTEDAQRHAAFVRRASAAYADPFVLAGQWEETSEAALRAAATAGLADWAGSQLLARGARQRGAEVIKPAGGRVRTQGWVIAVPDLLATLVVEASLHQLDLTLHLDTAPAAPPAGLTMVRATLEGLLGVPPPREWDDLTCALKGTGRMDLDGGDRVRLGALVERFPLFG